MWSLTALCQHKRRRIIQYARARIDDLPMPNSSHHLAVAALACSPTQWTLVSQKRGHKQTIRERRKMSSLQFGQRRTKTISCLLKKHWSSRDSDNDLPACQASPTALQGWMILQLSHSLLQCRNECNELQITSEDVRTDCKGLRAGRKSESQAVAPAAMKYHEIRLVLNVYNRCGVPVGRSSASSPSATGSMAIEPQKMHIKVIAKWQMESNGHHLAKGKCQK